MAPATFVRRFQGGGHSEDLYRVLPFLPWFLLSVPG